MKFELEPYSSRIPDNLLIKDMTTVAGILNKDTLKRDEYDKNGKYHSNTIVRRYGSWAKAIEKAGLKRYNVVISDSELIGDLVRVAKLLKKDSVTQTEYRDNGKFSPDQLKKRFGSWFEALEKVGLKKTRTLGITDEEYFENLEEVWVKLGRQPRQSDIEKPFSRYSLSAYRYRFGSFGEALESFVDYINVNGATENSDDTVSPKNEPIHSPRMKFERRTKRSITWRMRFLVMKRDGFKCKLCGSSPANDPTIILEVDHIIPWAKGGETLIENLQTLCSKCNGGKSDIIVE